MLINVCIENNVKPKLNRERFKFVNGKIMEVIPSVPEGSRNEIKLLNATLHVALLLPL